MLYRAFKVIETGQWVHALMTTAGDAFDIPASSHRRDIAIGLGLDATKIEVVDGDSDPRIGELLSEEQTPLPATFDWDVATDAERMQEIRGRIGL